MSKRFKLKSELGNKKTKIMTKDAKALAEAKAIHDRNAKAQRRLEGTANFERKMRQQFIEEQKAKAGALFVHDGKSGQLNLNPKIWKLRLKDTPENGEYMVAFVPEGSEQLVIDKCQFTDIGWEIPNVRYFTELTEHGRMFLDSIQKDAAEHPEHVELLEGEQPSNIGYLKVEDTDADLEAAEASAAAAEAVSIAAEAESK